MSAPEPSAPTLLPPVDVDTSAPKLAGKLAKVMSQVKRLRKSGFNRDFNYPFATDGDVSDLIRSALAEQQVAFIPSMLSIETTEAYKTRSGKSMLRTRAHFLMRFVCGETGQVLSAHWYADADDMQDKSVNKVATAAVKYFLLKTFLVSTGEPTDDPDAAGAGEDEPQGKGQTRKKAGKKTGKKVGKKTGKKAAPMMAPAWGDYPRNQDWLSAMAKHLENVETPAGLKAAVKAIEEGIAEASKQERPCTPVQQDWIMEQINNVHERLNAGE